jgi:uncharacterized protein
MVVIETDGTIQQSDILKSAYAGAPATGLDVTRSSFDDLLYHAGSVARQIGRRALAPACLVCPVGGACGGGLYAHRYRAGTGFANPSVYCPDLLRLIGHIRDTVQADVSALSKESE